MTEHNSHIDEIDQEEIEAWFDWLSGILDCQDFGTPLQDGEIYLKGFAHQYEIEQRATHRSEQETGLWD